MPSHHGRVQVPGGQPLILRVRDCAFASVRVGDAVRGPSWPSKPCSAKPAGARFTRCRRAWLCLSGAFDEARVARIDILGDSFEARVRRTRISRDPRRPRPRARGTRHQSDTSANGNVRDVRHRLEPGRRPGRRSASPTRDVVIRRPVVAPCASQPPSPSPSPQGERSTPRPCTCTAAYVIHSASRPDRRRALTPTLVPELPHPRSDSTRPPRSTSAATTAWRPTARSTCSAWITDRTRPSP